MEDADGILSISKKIVPIVRWKEKEANEYEKHIMGYCQQKGTWNNTAMPSNIGRL